MPLGRIETALASLLVVAVTARVAAADGDEHEGDAPEHEHEHAHHHANHVAIFVGGTSGLGDEGTTRFTIGADYEHRLPVLDHRIGVGALVDAAIGDVTATLVAPFVAIHPVGGLMLLGAVGVAVAGAGHDGHLALRGGAAYFVPVGAFSLGPEVSFDHVEGEGALVFGASLGTGF